MKQFRLPWVRLTCAPETWIIAFAPLFVTEAEIVITSRLFPDRIVLGVTQRGRFVEIALETDEIPHCRHGVVHNDVHASVMDISYEILPLLNCAKVRIQQCQIKRAEAVSAPRGIDQRAPRDVDASNSHGSKITESILEADHVASIPELGTRNVMFPSGPVNVIIGRVAIDKAIDSEGVEGETPVVWGRLICCLTGQRIFREAGRD